MTKFTVAELTVIHALLDVERTAARENGNLAGALAAESAYQKVHAMLPHDAEAVIHAAFWKAMLEFQDWTPPPVSTIPQGFVDESWHNDACPCLAASIDDVRRVRVWMDYADPMMRETGPEDAVRGQKSMRYTVSLYGEDGGHLDDVYSTDSYIEAIERAVVELKQLTQPKSL